MHGSYKALLKLCLEEFGMPQKKIPHLSDRGREIAEWDRVGRKSLPAAECEIRRGGT